MREIYMATYELGDMFWGKSQSYPWWPCVIMTSSSNEIKRTRKKTGTQYHVQFIGQNYDACWITNNFLIKYDGTESFESYVEQQLRSSLPPQLKLIYEMKMTGQIQAMWKQSCQDAENIYQLPKIERIERLPKIDQSATNSKITKKPKIKKKPIRTSCKFSETSSLSDNVSVSIDTKSGIDVEDQNSKDGLLDTEIEEICRKVYLVEETENRIKNCTGLINQLEIENMLNDQWNVLDIETKLLYLNGEASNTSKSRVSGRKIKVPSRLRRINELENMKKASLRKRISDPAIDKKKSNSQDNSLSSSVPCIEDSKVYSDETPSSLQLNSINRETFDIALLKSVTIKNSSMEIFKLIADNELSILSNICHQCLQPYRPNDKLKSCKGDCEATYHLMCSLTHKLFRSDDNNKCVNCVPKEFLCCICKNSKYMKKMFLVKCSKSGCPLYFHTTCMKFLNFIDSTSDEKEILVCPNHSCLTCSREDSKHTCNNLGALVTCIRCPISYHNNMLCIPAGCRVISDRKIICHRHFETNSSSVSNLTRCFVCFNENATLRCCRCRGVFHPKCMGLATYADLLKDFVCSTCKLDQPMFHGQIVWTEIDNIWTPAEIVAHKRDFGQTIQHNNDKSLVVRIIENGFYRSAEPCELVTFFIGEIVLKDSMTANRRVVECAKVMNMVYFNWRKRMRPFSEKCTTISQEELVKLSTISFSKPFSNTNYEYIEKNVYDDNVKNVILSKPLTTCSSSTGNKCSNYKHKAGDICDNKSCINRQFTEGFKTKPIVTENDDSTTRCVKVLESLPKGEIIGELTGRLISANRVIEILNKEKSLTPSCYIYQLQENLFLDCEKQGNEWRFVNHSCNPNAELVCWNVANELRLGVVTLRSVDNEKITINHRKSGLVLKQENVCNCRSSNCQKSYGPTSLFANVTNIIVPRCCIDNKIIDESVINQHHCQLNNLPHKPVSNVTVTVDNIPTVKTEEIPVVDNRDKDKVTCHRCGYHGELVTCNKANCKKRYHLQCVGISVASMGLWYCPKHFCIECGQVASVFCGNCSTSHCKNHSSLQKRHKCRRHDKSAKVIIQSNTSDCEEINNLLSIKPDSGNNMTMLKTDFTADNNEDNINKTKPKAEMKQPVSKIIIIEPKKSDKIVKQEIKIVKSNPSCNSRKMTTIRPDQILLLNKTDLYSACDLVPIVKKSEESELKTDNIPSNDLISFQRKRKNVEEEERENAVEIKRSLFDDRSESREDHEFVPEPVEDMRCLVNPMSIEESENLIISPIVLDD